MSPAMNGRVEKFAHFNTCGSPALVMWATASDESLKFGVQGASATNWFPRVNGARDNGIRLYSNIFNKENNFDSIWKCWWFQPKDNNQMMRAKDFVTGQFILSGKCFSCKHTTMCLNWFRVSLMLLASRWFRPVEAHGGIFTRPG